MMEMIGGLFMGLGSLIALIGWIWLIIIGFQKGGALWGILIFLFSWLAGIVFCVMNKTGWTQLAMMIIGGLLAVVGAVPMVIKVIENMPRQ